MATHAANSLISDLAEMVQAVEALPQVQAQLDQITEVNTKLATTIEARDAHIKSLQDAIEALQSSLKSTEASRDDAELRFLELEDRVGKLTSAFALAHQNVAMANAVATEVQGWLKPPPAPEPVAEAAGPQEFVYEPQGQSVANPTELTAVPSTDAVISAPSSVIPSENATSGTDTSYDTGVSVPVDPTGALPDVSVTEQASVSSAASEPTTASTQVEWPHEDTQLPLSSPSYPAPIPTSTPDRAASANGSASPSADVGGPHKGPYTDKTYSDVYGGVIITWSEWAAGGGTEDNYYR